MRATKKSLMLLAAGLLAMDLAHADICADLRAIHLQSQSHFDGWKKEAVAAAPTGKRNGVYASSFMLDGADHCTISGTAGADSTTYSCIWKFSAPADLGRAYARMTEDIKACPPLVKEPPGILNDTPEEKSQGDLRRQLEVTGFDYGDAQVLVMLGSMRLIDLKSKLAHNELKFSFIKSSSRH